MLIRRELMRRRHRVTNNLSNIIRGFKSACTVRIHSLNKTFTWQSRFFDHIIREEKDLYRIRMYIRNNPLRWGQDDHFRLDYTLI